VHIFKRDKRWLLDKDAGNHLLHTSFARKPLNFHSEIETSCGWHVGPEDAISYLFHMTGSIESSNKLPTDSVCLLGGEPKRHVALLVVDQLGPLDLWVRGDLSGKPRRNTQTIRMPVCTPSSHGDANDTICLIFMIHEQHTCSKHLHRLAKHTSCFPRRLPLPPAIPAKGLTAPFPCRIQEERSHRRTVLEVIPTVSHLPSLFVGITARTWQAATPKWETYSLSLLQGWQSIPVGTMYMQA
jgi:hypothetical protein